VELYFLGTAAGLPTRQRNVSSIALNLMTERGTVWLFDIGEGTQHQMLRSPLKPGRLEYIFITHLHGDHLFGLPGFLTSRSYQGGTQPLTIYGPVGIRKFVEVALSISQSHLDYELQVKEFDEGVVYEDHQFRVISCKLEHRIESYGFRIEEKNIPGTLDHERLQKEGVVPGPIYARLKLGEKVRLLDGTVLDGKEYTFPPIPGRTIVISGDTRPCEQELALAYRADVLVHEATYRHERLDQAIQYFHSTATHAANLALRAEVNTLIMTHISSRYQDNQVNSLLEEARTIFPNSHVAEDFWSFSIPRKIEKGQPDDES
jgi:ribonuclease Z